MAIGKMKTSGKVLIGALVAIALFFGKTQWWDNRSVEVDTSKVMKIGVVTWPGYAGGQLMNDGFEANTKCRFYKEYGITVEFKVLDDFLASRKAFENGEVDLLWCTVDALPTELGAKGTFISYSPKLVFQTDWSRGGDAIVVRPGITSVSDLKATNGVKKKVAVAQGTPSHSFLIDLLKTNGMSLSDIDVVYVASAIDAAAQFKGNAVDCAVVWSPDDADCISKVPGSKILASTAIATNIIADGFFAKDSYIKEHTEDLQKLYDGWMTGNAEINANTDSARYKAAKILSDKFQMKYEDALASMNNVRYVTHGDNKNFYGFGDKNSVTGDVLYTKMAVVYTGLQLVENPVSWRDASFSGFVTNSKLTGSIHDAEKVVTFAVATDADKTKKEFSNKKVSINFPTGSYLLTGDNKYTIIRDFLSIFDTYKNSNVRIRIEGNTDNVGSYESNVILSQKRAQAVKDYLVSEHNVDPNRIIVIGNGPKHAVADKVSGENINYRVTDFQLVQ